MTLRIAWRYTFPFARVETQYILLAAMSVGKGVTEYGERGAYSCYTLEICWCLGSHTNSYTRVIYINKLRSCKLIWKFFVTRTVQCENILLCYGVTSPYIRGVSSARTVKSFPIDRYIRSVPGEQGCNLNDSIAKERLKTNIIAFWKVFALFRWKYIASGNYDDS